MSKLREQIADELARLDDCGIGPVSRNEHLDDADAILQLILDASIERLAHELFAEAYPPSVHRRQVAAEHWKQVSNQLREFKRNDARRLLSVALEIKI